jgi:hypothetical protein
VAVRRIAVFRSYGIVLCGRVEVNRRPGQGAFVRDFLREFWAFLRVRKKFWLLPIIVIMGLVGGLVVLTHGSAVAPFIYVLF